jgi:hypothetical protein
MSTLPSTIKLHFGKLLQIYLAADMGEGENNFNKFWEEPIAYFPLILHARHRK